MIKKGIVYLLILIMAAGLSGVSAYAAAPDVYEGAEQAETDDVSEFFGIDGIDASDEEPLSILEDALDDLTEDSGIDAADQTSDEELTQETSDEDINEVSTEDATKDVSDKEDSKDSEKYTNAADTSIDDEISDENAATEKSSGAEDETNGSGKIKKAPQKENEETKEEETKEESIAITGITLDPKDVTVVTKKTLQIKATIKPENATEKLVWSSDDKDIATVDANGKVNVKRYGIVTITASAENNKKIKATCKIQTRFYDVNDESKYYYNPVYWAADKGITEGYDNVYFAPGKTCTRREMMIFLWRYAGKPGASGNVDFSDVKYSSNTDSFKAIRWGVSNGIINGYEDKTFRPDAKITRKDALIMLYRLAGKPRVSGSTAFSDVSTNKYSKNSTTYRAILWATTVGITNGYSDGRFKPDANCLREHIVTFLYRYNDKKSNMSYLATPSNLKAVYNGSSIKVTWKAVSNAKDYDVYRYIYKNKKFEKIATVSGTSYTMKQYADAGSVHRFKVVAKNGKVKSDITNEAKVICLNAPKFSSISADAGGVRIKWQKVSGARGYRIYRKTAGGGWKSIATTKSTSYYDKSVKDKTKYTYTIRAYTYASGKEYLSDYNKSGKSVTTKVMSHRGGMLAKAQDYASRTGYLILVDCHANKVGVYTGSKGKWKEKFYWTCTTGAGGTPTVKGVYTINHKRYTFGDSVYSVYYTSSFYGPYYFHSILYHAGTWNVLDGRLGQDLSHGCVRLATDNAKWIYDNIPVGTTVVTY